MFPPKLRKKVQLLQTLLEYGKSCIICKTLHLASYSFMYFKTCPLLYLNCIILFDAPWISRAFEDLQECCRHSGWLYFFLSICKFLIIFCLFEHIKTNISIMWKSSFLLKSYSLFQLWLWLIDCLICAKSTHRSIPCVKGHLPPLSPIICCWNHLIPQWESLRFHLILIWRWPGLDCNVNAAFQFNTLTLISVSDVAPPPALPASVQLIQVM